jgi:hypothetical protein
MLFPDGYAPPVALAEHLARWVRRQRGERP